MLQSGDIISGMYQVIREIGTGGMGVIYIGYHLHLQKQIVIKKIKETCVDRVNVRGEADILKQLRHTYLPQASYRLQSRCCTLLLCCSPFAVTFPFSTDATFPSVVLHV